MDTLLTHLEDVNLGRRARESLPETLVSGPARSGRMTSAVRAALEKTRAGDQGALAAWGKAGLAWREWQQGLFCSHYLELS